MKGVELYGRVRYAVQIEGLRACLIRVLHPGWLHDSGHQFQLMR
jgi:hypothetical protein